MSVSQAHNSLTVSELTSNRQTSICCPWTLVTNWPRVKHPKAGPQGSDLPSRQQALDISLQEPLVSRIKASCDDMLAE